MIYLRKSSEQEMVACFVTAEINSRRFKAKLRQFLNEKQCSRTLFTKPDLTSKKENRLRALALESSRGYLRRRKLFEGYPGNVTWHLVGMNKREINALLFIKHEEPMAYTNGTRCVGDLDLTQNFDSRSIFRKTVESIIAHLEAGIVAPPIIVVSKSFRTKKRVILEGHARACAYSLSRGRKRHQVLFGVSDHIDRLAYW